MFAQFLCDHINVSKKIVDIWHHAAHHAKPHMVVSIHQAGHYNMVSCIDHLGIIRLQIRTHCCDTVAMDENIAHGEVGNIGIQSKDDAAFKKSARRCHFVFLRVK